MYTMTYEGEYLHDPYSKTDRVVDLKLSSGLNECGECSFTVYSTNSLYDKFYLRYKDKYLILYDDDTVLFKGYIYEIEDNYDLSRTITAKGFLSFLGDVLIRPYTYEGSGQTRTDLTYAPLEPYKFFNWCIASYNEHVNDYSKKFTIDTNEADSSYSDYKLYSESTSPSSVSDVITNALIDNVGGYIQAKVVNDVFHISYFNNCTDVNTQIIDFGVNLLDFTKTDSTDSLYTSIYAEGGTLEDATNPIKLSDFSSGSSGYTDFYISGDIMYHQPSVEKYGYIEYSYSNTDITDVNTLVKYSYIQLKTLLEPVTTIEVKAIDLHLLMGDESEALLPGQLVRVRSTPHNFDSYMFVNQIDLDVDNPDQTTYTLGITYNNFTGIQNSKIKELNASIVANFDNAKALSDEAKATAEEAQTLAEYKAQVYKYEDSVKEKEKLSTVPISTTPYNVGDVFVTSSTETGETVTLVCTTAEEYGVDYSPDDWEVAPSTPYNEGDLWVTTDTETSSTVTKVSKESTDITEEFNNDHWEISSSDSTNFIKYSDTDGLIVGRLEDETLKGNVQIVSDPAINLRSGDTSLASFQLITEKDEEEKEYSYSSVRLGAIDGVNTVVDSNGMHIFSKGNAEATNEIAHIGYAYLWDDDIDKYVYAPFYTFGTRKTEDKDTNPILIGRYSFAEGSDVVASETWSHAEGLKTTASAYCSHAEGNKTVAGGSNSHAEGNECETYARCSHVEGNKCKIIDSYSGFGGSNSHAEGSETTVYAYASHAEGMGTTAGLELSGESSIEDLVAAVHVEGFRSSTTGSVSHAEGSGSKASGNASHAQNYGTIAASEAQTSMGKCNIEDADGVYSLIIGNGTKDSARSNALAVKWNGDIDFGSNNSVTIKNANANGTGLLAFYPIGAVYTSVYDTDPGSIFGGSWNRVDSDIFSSIGIYLWTRIG